MTKPFIGLCMVLLVSAFPGVANAATNLRWQDYELPGYQASQKSNYQAAEFILTTALEKLNAEPHPDDKKILQFLERLITICGKEGKYEASEQYCKIAIQFSEKDAGNASKTQLLKLGLAHIYGKERKYSLSEIAYRKILSQQPLPSPIRTRAVLGLAEVQTNEGKLAEAAKLFEDSSGGAMRGNTDLMPADRVRYARCLYLLGNNTASEKQLKQALSVDERELGPSQPPLAATLNNLAIVCAQDNRMVDAERYMRRAFAIAKQHHYADLADWQQNLSVILREQGKHSESPENSTARTVYVSKDPSKTTALIKERSMRLSSGPAVSLR